MRFLFIHPNFPGQFKHLAREYAADPSNEVLFACRFPNQVEIPGVRKIVVKPTNYKKNASTHQYLRMFEIEVYKSQSMWTALHKLKKTGFIPDIIYAHPGWGDCLLIRDVFPNAKYIAYMEYYYRAEGADVGFDHSSEVSYDRKAKTRLRNATNLFNMESSDWMISPTQWQASLHPPECHHKMSVLHEGIDTKIINPSRIRPTLRQELKIPEEAEIVTYLARNLEPYRGFEQAMRAIEILSQKRPKAMFVVVGGDKVSYGPSLANDTYKNHVMKKVNLPSHKVIWVNQFSYKKHLELLKISDVHIYLTYPFVLSWSFLESMAMKSAIVASNTTPVTEVGVDRENVLLTDFFDYHEIADKVMRILGDKKLAKRLGNNARDTVIEKYALSKIMPIYKDIIEDVLNSKTPRHAEDLKVNHTYTPRVIHHLDPVFD